MGVQILENLLNIRVPVMAAVEGRLDVHSEYALVALARNCLSTVDSRRYNDDTY